MYLLPAGVNFVITIISVVSGIVAIVEQIRKKRKDERGSWVLVCIVIVSIFFLAGSIMKNRLVKVPNVVGKTYNDACITLSRFGLNYDLTVNGKDMYVYEQGVEPGTIVNRGTKIILYTKRISSSEDVIDTYANNKEL